MQPVIVMPMHDPSGLMFPHLKTITPQLKIIFAQAFVSVTAITRERQSQHVAWLETDDFFQIRYHQTDIPVGEDFLRLYATAATSCHSHQILHLCFIDRVAFTLQSDYHQAFIADIQAVRPEHTPLIFQRSERAWATHPRNYLELEQMVTRVGELLFQKSLDFAWSHLVVQVQQLQTVLPYIKNRDISMVAEFIIGAGADNGYPGAGHRQKFRGGRGIRTVVANLEHSTRQVSPITYKFSFGFLHNIGRQQKTHHTIADF